MCFTMKFKLSTQKLKKKITVSLSFRAVYFSQPCTRWQSELSLAKPTKTRFRKSRKAEKRSHQVRIEKFSGKIFHEIYMALDLSIYFFPFAAAFPPVRFIMPPAASFCAHWRRWQLRFVAALFVFDASFH